MVHVIRLASCLRLWFQSVCSLMPSLSAYCLSWFSLTLDMGYLFMAAPAKRSRCSLPWEIDGETVQTVSEFIFGAPKSLQMVTAAMKLKDAYFLEGKL